MPEWEPSPLPLAVMMGFHSWYWDAAPSSEADGHPGTHALSSEGFLLLFFSPFFPPVLLFLLHKGEVLQREPAGRAKTHSNALFSLFPED